MPQTDELQAVLSSLDEFRVVREIGRGGMGAVFLAEERHLQRMVALKVLLSSRADDHEATERFLREARTAAHLSHPHVVSVLRVEEVGDRLVIVMPFVEGDTLADKLKARGVLPPVEVAQILREVAWALGYAHGRGIVHRDIKPENVIIERGTSRALVADFGIAHDARLDALTQSGVMVGTVHYMSPEQANGEPLTVSSDLYSLAVTGYYALTGAFPIDGPSTAAILVRHATLTPKPVREVRPDVPEELATAIDRCLAKNPADRFPTAESFADALGSVAGQSLEIPPLVRGWIAQNNVVVPVLTLLTLPVMISLKPALDAAVGAGPDRSVVAILGLGAFSALGIVWNVVLYAIFFEPFSTRRLLSAGLGLEDIRHGLRSELRQHQEERQAAAARRSKVGWVARVACAVWAGTTAASWIADLSQPGTTTARDATIGFVAVVLGLWYLASVLGAGSVLRRVRLKLWMGVTGRFLVRIASIGFQAAPRRVDRAVEPSADQVATSLLKRGSV